MAKSTQASLDSLTIPKKIRPISGVIKIAKQETPDTWTLHLEVAERDKDYLAGQFVSISPHQFVILKDLVRYFEYQKGRKEQVRAYSLASAPHEKYLAITIKPENYEPYPDSYPPLLSPLLASDLLLGRQIEILGYAGAYIMPREHSHADVVHLVAGSGIVPSFSVIKDELKKDHLTKHTLIYVNRSRADTIFHDELLQLEEQFTKRLVVKYFMTQERASDLDHRYALRRPSIDDVRSSITDVNETLFFACGPAITKWQKKHALELNLEPKPRFMEWVHTVMEELEVDKKHFKREIYG